MKSRIITVLACLLCSLHISYSKTENDNTHKGLIWSYLNGINYDVRAGVNIGGTSPLPLPQEIRSINSYSPGLAITIEGYATKWLSKKQDWGISIGFRLDIKDMNTDATVKNYGMAIINETGGKVEGLWTGNVKTKSKMSLLSIPVLGVYKINERWKVYAGPYFSYLMDGDFNGNVYEGHLRTPDATGSKIVFEGENIATYDFSNELRKFQWGAQIGGEWKAYKHLTVHADLTWGFNDIFRKGFETVSFPMYPIYLNIGFGYQF